MQQRRQGLDRWEKISINANSRRVAGAITKRGGIKMKSAVKLSLVVALALMLVPYSYAIEWVPAETLQQLRSVFQLSAPDPKGPVAAPTIGVQATGTQSPRTTPRGGISLDDPRGNDWWSEQPVMMTGGGVQPLRTTPRGGISLDDQRGNDWWSVPPTILVEE